MTGEEPAMTREVNTTGEAAMPGDVATEHEHGDAGPQGEGFRSGFVAVVGRPNVGKSTLINRILGRKVSIVSDKPNTTRTPIRGVLNRPDAQLVLVDTPGLHKPRTLLGERLNAAAEGASEGVDVVCLMVDGRAGVGRGDLRLLAQLPADTVVVVNKIDGLAPPRVLAQLQAASAGSEGGDAKGADAPGEGRAGAGPAPDRREYFAVSARTGRGVAELVDHLVSRLPEGPAYFARGQVTDVPEAFWVAELVREQLLATAREELPHSIATQVTEWEWPRIRCEILVERDSQKGIVIGRGGEVLKAVGSAVRSQLPPGAFLELHVKVDRDWQRREAALDRLGY
jgi:GTP-binding protein Era